MSLRTRIVVGLLVALAFASLLPSPERRDLTLSSYGEAPEAHGALYTLFAELDLEPRRNLAAASRMPDGTVWFIEPRGVCDGRIALTGDVDVLDADAVQWRVGPWIEAGGAALVLLEPAGRETPRCDAILGFALPDRRSLLPDETETPAEDGEALEAAVREGTALDDGGPGDPDGAIWDGQGARRPGQRVALARVDAAWSPVAREIPAARIRAFEAPPADAGWEVAATIAPIPAEGGVPLPFALERPVGEGRLLVLADASFVHNQRLDLADGALLAVDLARATGRPQLDERSHGLVAETSAVRFLAGSPAMPVFLGLTAMGLAVWWRGAAWPVRRLEDEDEGAPTFDRYLQSMASLYSRSRDYDDIAERYRQLCEARVRRHFGLPAETPPDALAERLEAGAGLEREAARRLTRRTERPLKSAGALREAARELDAWVEEVIH